MEVIGYNKDGSISIMVDGTKLSIPDDLSNRDRQAIAEWEAAGNTIPRFAPSPEELLDVYRSAIQEHIDSVARSKRYDSGVTFASYATDAEPNELWRAEAKTFVAWRSDVWSRVYAMEASFSNPSIPVGNLPTVEQVIDTLPKIVWDDQT